MNLKSLQHVIALAEEGQFVRAAERLCITQSALSKSIRVLEDDLGMTLFDRTRDGVLPTAPGLHFLQRARELVNNATVLSREMRLLGQGDLGELRIGSGPMPACALLPRLLARLLGSHPSLSVRVDIDSWPGLRQRLERGEIEFALTDSRNIGDADGLLLEPVAPAGQGGVFCRRGHPLARKKGLTAADCLAYPFASPKFDRDAERHWRRLFGLASDERLPVRLMSDDLNLLEKVALGSDALVVTSADVMQDALAKGTMVQLPGVLPPSNPANPARILAVSPSGRHLSPAALLVLDGLRQLQAGP